MKVRATPDFFDRLDVLLPSSRGEDGTPSRNDFESQDLFLIVNYFAEHWDDLPAPIPGRNDYRQRIGAGRTVATYAVTGQLAADGWIELVDIDIQIAW